MTDIGDRTVVWEGNYIRAVVRGRWEFAERKNITGIVGMIPITDDGRLVLVEQFRPALDSRVIELPAGLSVEFDIDLGYTKNSDRDFKIISDFDLDQETTDEWDYSNGSPKKHIYGTGKIAGGRHLIKIKTTNGNVRITKK